MINQEPPFTGSEDAPPKVLIVDDNPANIQMVYHIIKGQYQVLMATSGRSAIEICLEMLPDLVLMDVMMPDLSGLDTCKLMKQHPELANIPVIFVTGLHSQDDENACWDAGGVDFIPKPFNATTLKNRIKVHLMLKRQSDLLRRLAFLDGLTGVKNRHFFDQYLETQLMLARRQSQAICVLMVDIDYFKQYNDSFGHQMGDEALRSVAKALGGSCRRPADLVARYGGEEFVIVLPNTPQTGVERVVERIQAAIAGLVIAHPASATGFLTVSIGGMIWLAGYQSTEALLGEADKRLYRAKSLGRNQACLDVNMV
ncbi:GGDEF domain-containing response regulator [Shewanella litorisediminis]|uniref:diguanylate cyclase n=1 Tax=Shewanella litorisediminis TaxID=1173586 RepID=A0ABX7G5A7_9GAMM|nr:diguanylate cyclase [Shewanella litorisediminis]MCL2920204.1 diguanylate cyclase [Shewanella litorisediminis]QRH02491.1 diguanylate cyclase [Shewanella litorisediminis]